MALHKAGTAAIDATCRLAGGRTAPERSYSAVGACAGSPGGSTGARSTGAASTPPGSLGLPNVNYSVSSEKDAVVSEDVSL